MAKQITFYDRYRDSKEKGFRETFIRPLLVRMGFVGISNEHGSQEFGKDFVFSQLDRFGRLKHMVVQAKHEELINQGQIVDNLVSQVRQAFAVRYTLPSFPDELRSVSAVYVFNTGRVTPNATRIIHESLERYYAVNTQVFDGEQLEILSALTYYQTEQAKRNRLLGLQSQLALNMHIWIACRQGALDYKKQKQENKDAKMTVDVRSGVFHAMEEYISEPFSEHISSAEMQILWQRAQQIKAVVDKWFNTIVRVDDNEVDLCIKVCNEAIKQSAHLYKQVDVALAQLPEPTV